MSHGPCRPVTQAFVLGKARPAPRLRSKSEVGLKARPAPGLKARPAPQLRSKSEAGVPSTEVRIPTSRQASDFARKTLVGLVRAWRRPGADLARATAAAPKVRQRPASRQDAAGVAGQSCAEHRIAPLNPASGAGSCATVLARLQGRPGRAPAPAERRQAGRLQDQNRG